MSEDGYEDRLRRTDRRIRSPLAQHTVDKKRPVLLTMSDFYGTLAATRCFGRAGVPVVMADSHNFGLARWSRYVTRRVSSPAVAETERFIDWLLEFGRTNPGHVLCTTSDDLAWLFSKHRDELERVFHLDVPPLSTMHRILNKRRLHEACRKVGIEVPETWAPTGSDDLAVMAPLARYPALVKPSTQVMFTSHLKGVRVDRSEDLAGEYLRFREQNQFGDALLSHDPEASWPMVQAYYGDAQQNIYSLAGYVDAGGEQFVVRASRKILQRPRKLGIGLCFQDSEVDATLAAHVRALCREVGYHGVFEAEFIQSDGRSLLIDFNPRFYSQMRFEIDRALPLPLIAHAAARGDEACVKALVEDARRWVGDGGQAYSHRFLFHLLLGSQRLSGRMTAPEYAEWQAWSKAHAPFTTDAVADAADPVPAWIDVAAHLTSTLRHPRAFVRSVVLDQ